jgi:hypothetical protein
MKITTPEQELLGLLKKTEEEQINWLEKNEILKVPARLYDVCDHILFESLADLAERLWKKAREIKLCEGGDLLTALCDVAGVMENRKKCTQCEHESSAGSVFFWATDADAIHRIVAALIALQRAGVEL